MQYRFFAILQKLINCYTLTDKLYKTITISIKCSIYQYVISSKKYLTTTNFSQVE